MRPVPVNNDNEAHDFELTAGPRMAQNKDMVITDYLKKYTKGSEYMDNARRAEDFKSRGGNKK